MEAASLERRYISTWRRILEKSNVYIKRYGNLNYQF
jgi:RNase P subunit RPR2